MDIGVDLRKDRSSAKINIQRHNSATLGRGVEEGQ
jgi:hypothetical protein